MNTRRTVYFSGQVQGVGFRYTTVALARGFDVTGRVRNLRDGRVELIACGAPEEVDRFVQAVRQSMRGYIGEVAQTDAPSDDTFHDFRIAFD